MGAALGAPSRQIDPKVKTVSHYKSNLRDIEFNLFEVLERDEILGQGPFSEVDGETAREILSEVDRLARDELAGFL